MSLLFSVMGVSVSEVVRGVRRARGVLLVAVCLIMLNVIVARHDARLDMTRDKLYTLSAASERVMERLEGKVEVEVYLSGDLPPPFHTTRSRLEDLLEEYAATHGGLTYRFITPEPGDTAPEERGCHEVAMSQRSADAMSVRAIYRCVVLRGVGREHVIPDLRLTGRAEIDNLELELTRGFLALTRTRPRRLGVVTGLGGPADAPGFVSKAKGVFDELYGGGIEPVELDWSQPDAGIPDGLDAVVILDVEQPVSEPARRALDAHITGGGSLGWFQSASVRDDALIAKIAESLGPTDRLPALYRPVDTGLDAQIVHYGVRHGRDLVLDPERALDVTAWTRKGYARVAHPAVARADELARELSFLRYTSALVLPAPSSLELTRSDDPRVTATVAASSSASPRVLAEPLRTRTYEAVMAAQTRSEDERVALILALEGSFPGFFEANRAQESERARLLVVGSGDFMIPQPEFGYDEQLATQGQQLFFQGVEWLLEEDVLAEVRDRREPEVLDEVPEALRWRIQLMNIVFVPMLFMLVGYAVWLRRRARIEALQRDS